jgi:E3 SUMO-protein ligase PIAS1
MGIRVRTLRKLKSHNLTLPDFEFKSSPFYLIQQQLGETKECLSKSSPEFKYGVADVYLAMTAHRHTVSIPLRVSDHPLLSRVAKDPLLKVMVFCAAEGQGRQDISFPHQSEIKVNGSDIKANLRGLKNKPGSTRPVDITKDLRLNIAAYSNTVELTYALTNKASDNVSQVSCQQPPFLLPYIPIAFSLLRRSIQL